MLPATAPRRKWLKASQADNLFWINPLFSESVRVYVCVCLLTQLEYHAHTHTHAMWSTQKSGISEKRFLCVFFYYSLFTSLLRCGGERVRCCRFWEDGADRRFCPRRGTCANAATLHAKVLVGIFSRNSTSHVPRAARFSHYFWNDDRQFLWLPARQGATRRGHGEEAPPGGRMHTVDGTHGADAKLAPVGHENLMRPEGIRDGVLIKFMEYFAKG